MSKTHSKSTLQESWFCNSKYSLWVSKNASNTSKAYCKLCYKIIDLKSGGSNALDSHQKSKNIRSLRKQGKPMLWSCFFPHNLQNHLMLIKSAKVGPVEAQKRSLSSFGLDENILNAEIAWCLNVVKSHSFRSCDSLKNQFKVMFPDSGCIVS